MALTFTGTMSVATANGEDVRSVLWAALGCNIAWGIVDGTIHVLTSVTERARTRARRLAIRRAGDGEALARLRALLPEGSGQALDDGQLRTLLDWLRAEPEPDGPERITPDDLRAAVAIFALVVIATMPPVVPFRLIDDLHGAMRLSNAIALAMLFAIGWSLDRQIGPGTLRMRIATPLIGSVLVIVTIALGG
ncbi:VIT1/CCC1 transporter family protein [Rubellimicrobium roseum]|uniref:VIT family protein n=1 Tax=Rubellimicrobium roseum TaxID=687525 RepID=A0A5C4N8I2_9RHOB|nr:VIT1/CCC1 transporter family protein [Rubellimicrobium roseum]TNC65380.1 hypothetical protein FHG71_17660 [Rubellimicrobium roseum]